MSIKSMLSAQMVLNLLKNRIPINASTYGKLKRHKKVLREIGETQKFSPTSKRASPQSERWWILERISVTIFEYVAQRDKK